MTQAQYGASLGGPIVHDRTFYFANFEHRALNQSGLITISPANVSAINARLAASGYPGPPIYDGTLSEPGAQHATFWRRSITSSAQRISSAPATASMTFTAPNSRGAGGLSAASASAGLDDTDQTVAVSNIATFSPRIGQ